MTETCYPTIPNPSIKLSLVKIAEMLSPQCHDIKHSLQVLADAILNKNLPAAYSHREIIQFGDGVHIGEISKPTESDALENSESRSALHSVLIGKIDVTILNKIKVEKAKFKQCWDACEYKPPEQWFGSPLLQDIPQLEAAVPAQITTPIHEPSPQYIQEELAALFDPVGWQTLQKMFGDIQDKNVWQSYVEHAKRNGLREAAKTSRALFNPLLAGVWWLSCKTACKTYQIPGVNSVQ